MNRCNAFSNLIVTLIEKNTLYLGNIHYVNEDGNVAEALQADGAIKQLLYHESRDLLIVITDTLVLGQFHVSTDGQLSEITKVRFKCCCENLIIEIDC